MALSITTELNQIIAGTPRKPGPIHDALQKVQNWAAAGFTDADIAAGAAIAISKTEIGTFAEWTTWTPVVSGLTLGNGTLNGRRWRLGKNVVLQFDLTFGSTTSQSGAFAITGMPENAAVALFPGIAHALDSGPANRYSGVVFWNSVSELRINSGAGGSGSWGAATPFTWATGDVLSFVVVYQSP